MRPAIEDFLTLALGAVPLTTLLAFSACAADVVEVADVSDQNRALERSIEAYCQGMCEHETCHTSQWFDDCLEDCREETGWTEHWSNAYVLGVGECLAALPCGGKDDDCYEGAALELEDEDPELSAACWERFEGCIEAQGDRAFSDDLCFTVLALNDTSRREARACLERNCNVIGTCLANQGAFVP